MWPKNITFGEGTLYMKDMKDIEVRRVEETLLLSEDEISDEPLFRISSEPIEFELEYPTINSELVGKLAGVDLAREPFETCTCIEYTSPRQVQVRRHKKKRINKKWARRYGFRTVYDKVRIKDISLVSSGNGTYEFATNQRPEIVKGR